MLPEGLKVLLWNAVGADVDLEGGVLPSTLVGLQLLLQTFRRIRRGALPAGLRWLQVDEQLDDRMRWEGWVPEGVEVLIMYR